MQAHSTTGVDDTDSSAGIVPWGSIEKHRASAFLLAGSLMIASFVVPVGISAVTDWAWASGILLIGFAIIAVVVGLFGLYRQTSKRTPRVAVTGALFAGIAASAALGLIAGLCIVLVAELGLRLSVPRPTGMLVMIALTMAGGFSLAFLLFGIAARKAANIPRHTGLLLVGGGVLLLLPVIVETLGLVYSVGTPPWLLFPILGVLAIDMLVIGYRLS